MQKEYARCWNLADGETGLKFAFNVHCISLSLEKCKKKYQGCSQSAVAGTKEYKLPLLIPRKKEAKQPEIGEGERDFGSK